MKCLRFFLILIRGPPNNKGRFYGVACLVKRPVSVLVTLGPCREVVKPSPLERGLLSRIRGFESCHGLQSKQRPAPVCGWTRGQSAADRAATDPNELSALTCRKVKPMTCARCSHEGTKKCGYSGRKKLQRYRCLRCSATFVDPTAPKPLGTHYTDLGTAARVLELMMDGASIRAISRLTGLHIHTILSIMVTA